MKTEVKAIIASVVVIALCLAAVGGVTYSWFSDSEQAEVDITAGNIDLDMTIDNVKIQSYNGIAKDVSSSADSPTITDVGGKVYYTTENTSTSSTSTTAVRIVFNGAVPGDVLSFDVSGTLANTINVYYSESSSITSNDAISTPFTVEGLAESAVHYPAGESDSTTISSHTIKVGMDTDATEMGQNYTILIVFQAYQANAPMPSDEVTSTITEGENNLVVYPTSSDNGESAGIYFEQSETSKEILTVTAIDSSDSGYAVTDGQVLLTGIDVTSSSGQSALVGIETTVTFKIYGQYDATDLTFYHNGTTYTPTSPTVEYDSSNSITTVSFATSDGFSAYYVSVDPAVSIGKIGYAQLEFAIDAAKSGDTIVLNKDCEVYNSVTIDDKTLDINLGSYTITSDTNVFYVTNEGNLKLTDGTIKSAGSPLSIRLGGEATANNTVFDIDDSIYVGLTSYNGQNATTDVYTYVDKLTLNNVTVDSTYGCICGFTNCDIDINGGTFNDDIGGGLLTNGTKGLGNQNWDISDATFNIEVDLDKYPGEKGYLAVGIQCHNDGIWNISGCTFNIDGGVAISARGGDVTVTECTYNYTNNNNNTTTGKLQFTDVAVDLTIPHAVATWYNPNGSYGYDSSKTTLTIDNKKQTLTENEVAYYDFSTSS